MYKRKIVLFSNSVKSSQEVQKHQDTVDSFNLEENDTEAFFD